MPKSRLVFWMRVAALPGTILCVLFFNPADGIEAIKDWDYRGDHLMLGLPYVVAAFLSILFLLSSIAVLFFDGKYIRYLNIFIVTFYCGFIYYGSYLHEGPGLIPSISLTSISTLIYIIVICANVPALKIDSQFKGRKFEGFTIVGILFTFFVIFYSITPTHPGKEWITLTTQAGELQDRGDFQGALVLTQNALHIAESCLSSKNRYLAHSYYNLANTQRKLGDYTQAKDSYAKALDIYRQAYFIKPNLMVALTLGDLGDLAIATGELELAQASFAESLMILEDNFEQREVWIGEACFRMALYYLNTNDFSEAEVFARRAVKLAFQNHGLMRYSLAYCREFLAKILIIQKKYEEARGMLVVARNEKIQKHGSDHAVIGRNLNIVAWSFEEQGELEEAIDRYKRARSILQRQTDSRDDLKVSLEGLARIYKKQGRHDEYDALVNILQKMQVVVETGEPEDFEE